MNNTQILQKAVNVTDPKTGATVNLIRYNNVDGGAFVAKTNGVLEVSDIREILDNMMDDFIKQLNQFENLLIEIQTQSKEINTPIKPEPEPELVIVSPNMDPT